ncbi:hypothetical protein I5Q34_02005 [Streptomyces sp. AV19]|uniref:hypothetical protein n=1 Tax=Streptomyces sp. AV19 TaxID=2793068 RepID=UPI0018FE6812|nr:hypothetical protein [Streptomyces sp. AV19]MBH1933075.1 hypothetical protein [Streptomyces sp. AV19]MDG4531787.1 hypothetical protein [Streptomyces sp. AV19]
MSFVLHQEADVTVVAIRPWGLDVESRDGNRGLIDNTKDPAWPSGDRSAVVGSVLHIVVIDDQRDPARLSALDVDLEIARELRAADGR